MNTTFSNILPAQPHLPHNPPSHSARHPNPTCIPPSRVHPSNMFSMARVPRPSALPRLAALPGARGLMHFTAAPSAAMVVPPAFVMRPPSLSPKATFATLDKRVTQEDIHKLTAAVTESLHETRKQTVAMTEASERFV